MSVAAVNPSTFAPRAAMLLPIAFLFHLAEEWFGGFLQWAPETLGYDIGIKSFALINGIGFLVFTAGTISSMYYSRMAWFAVSFATVLGLNGFLHTLATLGFGTYSPGTFTGFLLYLPLSIWILKILITRLSTTVFARSLIFGTALHGLVAFIAFI